MSPDDAKNLITPLIELARKLARDDGSAITALIMAAGLIAEQSGIKHDAFMKAVSIMIKPNDP